MSNKLQKRLPLVFVATLAIVLASVMTFSIAGIATADTAKSPVDKLEIGQFSDIHYFPDCLSQKALIQDVEIFGKNRQYVEFHISCTPLREGISYRRAPSFRLPNQRI